MSIVPDEITPRSAWRAWGFDGTHILSMRGDVWKPGEAMEAACPHMDSGTMAVQSVGTASFSLVSPTEEQLREMRKSVLASHGAPNALVSSYDVDTGERYVPFGKESRLWIPNVVSDEKPTAPGEKCSCGIYSTNVLETAKQYARQSGRPSMRDPLANEGGIIGRVALWGRIVVHADGYRAQYAYPQSFFTDDEPTKEALAKYNVPILLMKELPRKEQPSGDPPFGRPLGVLPLNSATTGIMSAARAYQLIGASPPGAIVRVNVPRGTSLGNRFWQLPELVPTLVIASVIVAVFLLVNLLLTR